MFKATSLAISLASLAVVAASNEFGVTFLAENKGKDGVITLEWTD